MGCSMASICSSLFNLYNQEIKIGGSNCDHRYPMIDSFKEILYNNKNCTRFIEKLNEITNKGIFEMTLV